LLTVVALRRKAFAERTLRIFPWAIAMLTELQIHIALTLMATVSVLDLPINASINLHHAFHAR